MNPLDTANKDIPNQMYQESSNASLDFNDIIFFHGTKNKIDKLKPPSYSRPFFVCGDVEYAYAYAYAGQVNGRTSFTIKQQKPGFVYALALSQHNMKLFDALNNNDISKLSSRYPKYVIESLKTKEWSIWSIFQHINSVLYGFYQKHFKNVDQLEKYLNNKGFKDQLGNNLFYNGIDKLLSTYSKQYKQIYSGSKSSWQCLFELIMLFNSHIVELGYNSFINRENVSKVKEADSNTFVTRCAIGLFEKECLEVGIAKPLDIDVVKSTVNQLYKKDVEKRNAVKMLKAIADNTLAESKKQIDFSKYEILQLEGKDLEAILPHLRPLIKKSYEKIGGKQGDRTVEQLKAVQTLAQVVYDKGKIIAYALAKKVHDDDVGNKINLIGCDQTWKGKEAMQAIIKYNIDNFKANVWCECSGVIEHWFKKYDGYPIPNQLVPEIIGEPRDKVWMHEDGYHYRRFLAAAHGRFVQKLMFGFVNNEVMRETLNQVGYDIMKDKINGKIHEDDKPMTALQKAEQFVSRLDKLVDEGMDDLPSIGAFLDKAVEILEANNSNLAGLGKSIQKKLKPIKTGKIKA